LSIYIFFNTKYSSQRYYYFCSNIIISVLNIFGIKNSIICVMNIIIFTKIKSINIKNIIFCVVNIIIFIIINIINKIITKLE
jgi:hypothetical protein